MILFAEPTKGVRFSFVMYKHRPGHWYCTYYSRKSSRGIETAFAAPNRHCLKGIMSLNLYSNTSKSQKTYLYQMKSKNSSPVLLSVSALNLQWMCKETDCNLENLGLSFPPYL